MSCAAITYHVVNPKDVDLYELVKLGVTAHETKERVVYEIRKRLGLDVDDEEIIEHGIFGLSCLNKPCAELTNLDIDRVVAALRERRDPDNDLLLGPKPGGSRAIMAIHKDDPLPREWAKVGSPAA